MRRVLIVTTALVFGFIAGCSRAVGPHGSGTPSIAATASPPPAPASAKKAVMICRSSIDGRSVKCGTPNAVMVGMKTE